MCVWLAGDISSSTASAILTRYLPTNPDGVFYAVRKSDGSIATKRYLPQTRNTRVVLPRGDRVVAHLRLATSDVAQAYIHGWQLDMKLPASSESERWYCAHNGVGIDHRQKGVDSLSFFYELREQLKQKCPPTWNDAAKVIRRVYEKYGDGRYVMASVDLDVIICFGDVELYRVYSSYVVASRSLDFEVVFDGLRFKPARTTHEGMLVLQGTPLRVVFHRQFPASSWTRYLRKNKSKYLDHKLPSSGSYGGWYGSSMFSTLPTSTAWKCLCSYGRLNLPRDIAWRIFTVGHYTGTAEICCPHKPICPTHHATGFTVPEGKEVVGWGNSEKGYHVITKDGSRVELT